MPQARRHLEPPSQNVAALVRLEPGRSPLDHFPRHMTLMLMLPPARPLNVMQSRAMCAMAAEKERDRFLVGSLSLKGVRELGQGDVGPANDVLLLE